MKDQLLAMLCSCLKEMAKRARPTTAAPGGELGPISLLLSRKDAELVYSSAQPPVSTGDGHVATRSLHWPFVVWPRNSSVSLPVSPGGLCSVRGVLSVWVSSLAKPWSPLPFRLEEEAPPAMAAQYPAHTRMLNFFQLWWHLRGHSDNRINFLITLLPVPVSGNPQGLT